MAYTLNTSHPLYANLVELIGVQSGALVSHKMARTFTPVAGSSYGAGTYGEHFQTGAGGYSPQGASFSPAIGLNTVSSPDYTVLVVLNSRGAATGQSGIVTNSASYSLSAPAWTGAGRGTMIDNYTVHGTSGTTLSSGAQMLTLTRSGESVGNLKFCINNGTVNYSDKPEYNSSSTAIDTIGGYAGQGSLQAGVVWIVIFDKILSAAEIDDLFASLGADNAFGLVSTGGGTPELVPSAAAHAHTADNVTLNTLLTLSIANATHAHAADSITITAVSNGTITIPAVKDWGTGNLKTGETGVQVDIRNISTGALVVRKTGQTTHGTTGVCVVTDASIVAGTTYEVVTRFADGSKGMWDYTAT